MLHLSSPEPSPTPFLGPGPQKPTQKKTRARISSDGKTPDLTGSRRQRMQAHGQRGKL
jgi:hypothetical protein